MATDHHPATKCHTWPPPFSDSHILISEGSAQSFPYEPWISVIRNLGCLFFVVHQWPSPPDFAKFTGSNTCPHCWICSNTFCKAFLPHASLLQGSMVELCWTGTPYLFISHKLAPSDTNGFSLLSLSPSPLGRPFLPSHAIFLPSRKPIT